MMHRLPQLKAKIFRKEMTLRILSGMDRGYHDWAQGLPRRTAFTTVHIPPTRQMFREGMTLVAAVPLVAESSRSL